MTTELNGEAAAAIAQGAAIAIPLRNKDRIVIAHTVVDVCDAALEARRWHLSVGYARTRLRGGGHIHMHRLLLDPPPGTVVDHINGDPLDNRRSNLRVVTQAENQQNRAGASCQNRSGYRGVHWHAQRQKWQASATLSGAHHYLGVYETAQEAGDAAAAFRAEHMPASREARSA